MSAFRKGGSFVALTWVGKLEEPTTDRFAAALAHRRFRTIEDAASEEVSAGWVTPVDPSGTSFTPDAIDAGAGTWLRVRIDRKQLPQKWVQIHLAAAEGARGRRLSARERKELRADLMEKLLPRVLPTTSNVDALLFHEKRLVLLFATSKGARETFGKLFFESFAAPLQALDPLQLALRDTSDSKAGEAIEKLEPTRWPMARRAS